MLCVKPHACSSDNITLKFPLGASFSGGMIRFPHRLYPQMNSLGSNIAEHCKSGELKSSRNSSPCFLHLRGTSACSQQSSGVLLLPGEQIDPHRMEMAYNVQIVLTSDTLFCVILVYEIVNLPTIIKECCGDGEP